MPWGEAVRLMRVLVADPTSQLAAAVAGWDHPWSHEYAAIADLFDLEHYIAWAQSGRQGPEPEPVRRPWPVPKTDTRGTQRLGNTEGRTRAEVVEYLNSLGHHLTV